MPSLECALGKRCVSSRVVKERLGDGMPLVEVADTLRGRGKVVVALEEVWLLVE